MQKPGAGTRAAQADRTRTAILKAAVKVFSRQGYAGARTEQIASQAQCNERMIYYYFGSKDELFVSVLEHIYAQFNRAEARQRFDLADPRQAIRDLVAFTWNYYLKHPEFITILGTENLLQGAHARKSSNLRALSGTAVGMLEPIVKAGQQQGLFREDIDIRHVYLMIASLCYFYNSNLHTLSCFLDDALASPKEKQHWLEFISDLVLRGLARAGEGA